VAFVLVGEQLVGDVKVAARPHLIVEAADENLVRFLAHSNSR
jgi:hypothetical protein